MSEAAADVPQARSSLPLLSRLSVMMFLQYFVQGCYLPIAALYVVQTLGFTEREKGVFISALAVGPILAPFVVGQIVDRAFSTERVMAFCHLVGGALMLALYYQTGVWPVIVLGTVYSILYVPTMMLSNSLAFQHLKNTDMEFPWIRAFGTLGFIIPAFIIEGWWLQGLEGTDLAQARGVAFALSGIFGIVMAVYCLSLPHTPPQGHDKRKYAPGVVMAMLRQRQFLVIVVVTFFICIAHQYFFNFNSPFLRDILDSGGWEGAVEQRISSIGQWCEIGVMAVLGFLLIRLGFKWTLIIGASAYMLRCLLFALVFGLDLPFAGRLALACTGQALHGFCFGCFLAVGYMYVDRISPRDVRGSMQNIYGVFFVSLGFFVGGLVGGEVGNWFSPQIADIKTNLQVAPSGEVVDGQLWEPLGVFQIDSGALVVEVSDDADGVVIADAIRMSPSSDTTPPSPPATPDREPTSAPTGATVVDDGDAGYSETGSGWIAADLADANGGDYRFAHAGDGVNKASWEFGGLAPGSYEVYATWTPQSDRASNATFTVLDGKLNNWAGIWLTSAAICAACVLALLAFFPSQEPEEAVRE